MTFKYHVAGEKFGCMRTDVLLKFPFPEEIAGFVPESLVWRAIARAGYMTRFVNQVFRVYHDSEDSLSRQGKESHQHALGLWLLAQDTVVECLPWFRYQPRAFLLAAARYTRFYLHLRAASLPPPRGRSLRGMASRALVYAMWPVGAALDARDRRRVWPGSVQAPGRRHRFVEQPVERTGVLFIGRGIFGQVIVIIAGIGRQAFIVDVEGQQLAQVVAGRELLIQRI